MNKNKKILVLINVVIPIVIGAVTYYLYSPDVLFVKNVNSIIGVGYHEAICEKNHIISRFIRNYFLDMLWAYALIMTLFFVMYDNTANVSKLLCITISFSITMEILQIIPSVNGKFDLWDVVVEILAMVIAVLIIKNYFVEEKRE